MNANWDAIDAALRNVLMNAQPWANAIQANVGTVFIDTVPNPVAFWICNVTHTTVVGPGTFAQERIANPTFWTAFSFGIQARGAWANNTNYLVNDIAYDSVRGITGIVKTSHLSNSAGSILDDAVNWNFIVNLPTVFTAVATNYNNAVSHLAAVNVQDAVDQLQGLIAGAYVSSNITYDHTISGLASINVKAAIDELKSIQVIDENAIAANTTAITTGTIATGFCQWRPTTETLVGWQPANGLTIGSAGSGATGRANVDTAALYAWHWNNFSNTQCPVSTGRGANAAADFAANKTITILDLKGTFGGLGIDTMGGAASTRLNSVPVTSGNSTTAGSVLGENLHTLLTAELASHLHAVFAGVETHSHAVSGGTLGALTNTTAVSAGGHAFADVGSAIVITAAATGLTVRDTAGGAGTANQTGTNGSGTPHNTVPRAMTGTWYLKL